MSFIMSKYGKGIERLLIFSSVSKYDFHSFPHVMNVLDGEITTLSSLQPSPSKCTDICAYPEAVAPVSNLGCFSFLPEMWAFLVVAHLYPNLKN